MFELEKLLLEKRKIRQYFRKVFMIWQRRVQKKVMRIVHD